MDSSDFVIKRGVLKKYKGKGSSVFVPEGVTAIGTRVFANCSELVDIEIPDGVTTIGSWAFAGCSSLERIVLPKSVRVIGVAAFENCSNLLDIVIPDSDITIEINAFSGCEKLVNSSGLVVIHNKVVFCSREKTHVSIPKGITEIYEGAFSYCKLIDIEIPDSVTTIGERAFSGCSSLEKIVLPKSVSVIGYRTFDFCSSLEKIVLPKGVSVIGEEAFRFCSKLIDMEIPDSVTTIGERAFSGCSSLEKIVLPKCLTVIGNGVLSDCYKLVDIEIPDGVITIGDGAFGGFSRLERIVLPKSVTVIGNSAFWGCSRLVDIEIPDGVTTIGDRAFANCESLKKIVLPDSIEKVGSDAFEHTNIKSIFVRNLEVLSAKDKPQAVVGFITNFSEFSESDVKKYLTYIRKNTSRLLSAALTYIPLLRLMLDNECLNQQMLDQYIKTAEETNNLEAKAMLMAKKGDNLLGIDDAFNLEADVGVFDISGKRFVVSGDLIAFPESTQHPERKELRSFIEKYGGKLTGSVSGKTDYLICNDISIGTNKVLDAQSLGVKIICEDEFFEMVGERPK